MKVEHWAEYYYPGSLFDEEQTIQMSTADDVKEALEKMPAGAHSFILFDLEIRSGKLEDGEEITNRRRANVSPRFYPDGTHYDLKRIEQEFGKDLILYGNVRQYDPPAAVKTRRGNFQPLVKGARIL